MSSENRSPGPMLTRRTALKAGAGAGVAALGLSGVGVPNELEMAQDAEAGVFLTAGIGMVGYMSTSYALRRMDIIGATAPPDGLGPDALQNECFVAGKKRWSNMQSTIVDNDNIVNYLPEAVFSEGKIAALEAIKNGATETDAINAGQDKAKEHMATVEKNFWNTWNEGVHEIANLSTAVESHSELNLSDVYTYAPLNGGYFSAGEGVGDNVTLRDGSTMDIYAPERVYSGSTFYYSPVNHDHVTVEVTSPDGTTVMNLENLPFYNMNNAMQSEFDDILNNISLWVDNTYDQIQTGEISPDEYLSGVDLANSLYEDDNRAMAIGDLIAMNIPGDYDHESTIQLEDDNAKVVGYLSYTGEDSTPTLNAGTTVEPANFSGTWYLTYRPGSYIEEWTAYDSEYGIQGGEVRFTSDPTTNEDGFDLSGLAEYAIDTTHDETAVVGASDFTESTDDSGNTIWVVDLTDKLEQTITGVDRVRRTYAGDQPDTYTSMALDQPATILEVEGTDALTIQEDRDPQTDTNYITEEEWQDLLDQQQELIDEYEDATSSAGGGWSPDFNVPTVGPLDSIEDWTLAGIVAVVGSAVFGNLS